MKGILGLAGLGLTLPSYRYRSAQFWYQGQFFEF